MKRALLFCVLAVLASAARAQQTLLPAYGLPVPDPALAPGAARLALQGGYGVVSGAGASLHGFFGGWAIEAAASERWSFGAGCGGHGLGGNLSLPTQGSVGATAVGVDPGGFIARRFEWRGLRAALHGGLSFPFETQSYAVSVLSVSGGGKVSLTPDQSYALSVSVPVGLAVTAPLGPRWSVEFDATVAQTVAGKRWDTYAFVGPVTPARTSGVSPYPVFRASASVRHASSGLAVLGDYAARPRVDGNGGLWAMAARLGWNYGLRSGK